MSFEQLAVVFAVGGLWLPSLLVVPGLADEFRLPKLASAEAIFLLSVLFLALSKKGFGSWRANRLLLLSVGPLFAVATLSVLLGAHPAHGRIALWNFAVSLVVLVAWGNRALRVEQVLGWLIVPAVIGATMILLQRFDLWQPLDIEARRSRLLLTGLVGNVGEASLYLALPVGACLAKLFRDWVGGRKVRALLLWATPATILLGAIVVAQTATAQVAVLVGTVILAVSLPLSRTTKFATIATVAAVLLVALWTPAGERMRTKLGELETFNFERLTTARTDGWKAARYMLQQNPAFGIGFGAYGAEFTPAKEAALASGTRFFERHVGQSTFSNAHSEPLEWAAETGWVGFAALVWAMFAWASRIRRRLFSSKNPAAANQKLAAEVEFEDRIQRSMVLVAVWLLLLYSLTYFPFRTALLGYPFVLLLAALWSGGRTGEAGALEDSSKTPSDPQTRWLFATMVAGLLVVSMISSMHRIQASARLFLSESTATSMMRQNRIYPSVLRTLMGPLVEAMDWTPWDERIPLALGSYSLLLQEPEQAVSWYQKSLRIAPRPETIFNLGRAELARGRETQAVELWTRAVLLDPLRLRAVKDSELEERVRRAVAQRRERLLP